MDTSSRQVAKLEATMPTHEKSDCAVPTRRSGEDLSGRDRLVSNVLNSWAAYGVFIVAGFILPRMIDRRLGQELLGVWDFSWSLVTYFEFIRGGIGSSVNRYVARYRAAGDTFGVNTTVSSATCMLGLAGLLVVGLSVAVSLLLPRLFDDRLGDNLQEAQWVVFFLGIGIGVQIAFSAFNGVLTGCHRWALHNLNKSGWYAAAVIGMVVALLSGGSLWTLAVIMCAQEALAAVTRLMLAHAVCEGLRLRLSLVKWEMIRRLFAFGGKTLLPSIADLLLVQTSSILIVAYLGPASLALFNRPQSLMRHTKTLVNRMAMTLMPTVSSLDSTGEEAVIRRLVVTATRYSVYMVLPVVLVLVIFGGSIMRLWMGPRYADGLVPAILAIGSLAVLVQMPALNTLAGVNAHGRAGVARLIASLCSIGLNVLVLWYFKYGLVGAAIAVTLPLTILNLVDIPRLICRRVGLGMRQYFLAVTVGPAVHILPFALCLVLARIIFNTRPFVGLGCGGFVGGVILAIAYWRHVLPERVKAKAFRIVGVRGSMT